MNRPQPIPNSPWRKSLDPEKTGETACPTTKDQLFTRAADPQWGRPPGLQPTPTSAPSKPGVATCTV